MPEPLDGMEIGKEEEQVITGREGQRETERSGPGPQRGRRGPGGIPSMHRYRVSSVMFRLLFCGVFLGVF